MKGVSRARRDGAWEAHVPVNDVSPPDNTTIGRSR
jgi:hypothetical protein